MCQNCEGMKSFVVSLQEEIKRLADITGDLQRQLTECGGTPVIPDHLRPNKMFLGPDGKTYLPAFKNICPGCKTFKQTERPTSAGRIRQQGTFRIRKGKQRKISPKPRDPNNILTMQDMEDCKPIAAAAALGRERSTRMVAAMH